MQLYIVHYGEMGLKGHNLPDFEKRLRHNLLMALRDLGEIKVRRFHRYLMVEAGEGIPAAEVEARLPL